jgi:phosphopantothenoylcysteine synthetase/decarboxylase
VILTPSALKFGNPTRLAEVTGHPARSDYKRPEEPDVLPAPDAFAVAPCTFNTVGKWSTGISDTLALGLLNEAIGMGLPIIVAPWPNVPLARHPAFERSVADLRAWGLTLVYDPANLPGKDGDPATFPWEDLRAEVLKLDG